MPPIVPFAPTSSSAANLPRQTITRGLRTASWRREVRAAGLDLVRHRVAVLGRAALEHVADERRLARHRDARDELLLVHRRDDLGQQVAGAADERLAATVLLGARGLADEDDPGRAATDAGHGLRARLVQAALRAGRAPRRRSSRAYRRAGTRRSLGRLEQPSIGGGDRGARRASRGRTLLAAAIAHRSPRPALGLAGEIAAARRARGLRDVAHAGHASPPFPAAFVPPNSAASRATMRAAAALVEQRQPLGAALRVEDRDLVRVAAELGAGLRRIVEHEQVALLGGSFRRAPSSSRSVSSAKPTTFRPGRRGSVASRSGFGTSVERQRARVALLQLLRGDGCAGR